METRHVHDVERYPQREAPHWPQLNFNIGVLISHPQHVTAMHIIVISLLLVITATASVMLYRAASQLPLSTKRRLSVFQN